MFLSPLPHGRDEKPSLNVTREKFQELTPTWPDNNYVPGLLLTPCISLFSLTVLPSLNPLQITLCFLTSLTSASWPQISDHSDPWRDLP